MKDAYFKLCVAAFLPAAAAALIALLEKKNVCAKLNPKLKQLIIGIVFGGFAILGTEWGISAGGAQLNCRDAAVLIAGLFFGAPAGIIAGVIGAAERWIAVAWGVSMFTRVACTVSTFLAGIYAGLLRRHMFENKRPGWLLSMAVGVVMEVFHMTMVFLTNMSEPTRAMAALKACAAPMIAANGLSVMLASMLIGLVAGERLFGRPDKVRISSTVQRWMLVAVVIAFAATSVFMYDLQTQIAYSDADPMQVRNIALYANTFMEILVFAVLFGMIYTLIKRVVVDRIQEINGSLAKITAGDLDEVVDVRSNAEFSSLSDGINSTVGTLKQYIDEAEARIAKELQLARDIQMSALPKLFKPSKKHQDMEIYALMDPAKEVGGDFYDFYMNHSNTLHVLVADVSGKGIPAALFMMRAKTELKTLTEADMSLPAVFSRGNEALCDGNDAGMFVTAWQCSVDLVTGFVRYVNAGHNPPLVKKSGGAFEYLRTRPGFVLGGMEGVKYKAQELQLSPGDIIFLYTDGVTEATNADSELYGEERLRNALNAVQDESMEALCRRIKADVDAFVADAPQFDDITMVAFRYNGRAQAPMIHYAEAALADIEAVTEFADAEMEKLGVSQKSIIQMNIAIDEIYSNIVNHGYAGGKGPVTVQVLQRDNPNRVILRFIDEGVPYNPLTRKDPDISLSVEDRGIGGLGIYMVKKMMDDMRYEYANGQNILSIMKKY